MHAQHDGYFTKLVATDFVRPGWRDLAYAGIGGFLGIGLVGGLSYVSDVPLLMAPLGASAVLLFGLPQSPLSQPRHVLGGHGLSLLIGLACLALMGSGALSVSVGVGLSLLAMLATRTVHPPAGANPIILLMGEEGVAAAFSGFALPGFFGALLLVVSTILVARFTGLGRPTRGAR